MAELQRLFLAYDQQRAPGRPCALATVVVQESAKAFALLMRVFGPELQYTLLPQLGFTANIKLG